MVTKEKLLENIKGGLIVSCQARKGWPMYGSNIMSAFARAAEMGGAVGIRANEPGNIKEIKKQTSIPVFGIYKQWTQDSNVYITPTLESANSVIKAGADVIAIDATNRKRPSNENIVDIISNLKKDHPDVLIMGDIGTYNDGIYAEKAGCDVVATTLSGFTTETENLKEMDYSLIDNLSSAINIPVIAEGRINNPYMAKKAIQHGAHSVVVGTMITRPEIITETFVNQMRNGVIR